MEKKNGNVKWWQLVPLLISLIVVCGAVGSFALATHKEQPHPQAVKQKRMDRFEGRIDKRLDKFERKLDKIIEHLK